MSTSKTLVALLAGCSILVSAQIPGFGPCPSPTVIPTFDGSKYAGVWYEYSKYMQGAELLQDCITATYTTNPDGSMNVFNKGRLPVLGGHYVSVNGTARPATTPANGQLAVTFSFLPMAASNRPYWVLGTDYTTYAVVWSCTSQLNMFHMRSVWILSRKQNPDASTISAANQVLDNNGINRQLLTQTGQPSNC